MRNDIWFCDRLPTLCREMSENHHFISHLLSEPRREGREKRGRLESLLLVSLGSEGL